MSKRNTYQNINMEQTGARLKHMLESAGYTPRMIQDYLHLSCVQPVYRWYKGLILPSVDHLLMLSELLNVHMEDFLVKKGVLPMSDGEGSSRSWARSRTERFRVLRAWVAVSRL